MSKKQFALQSVKGLAIFQRKILSRYGSLLCSGVLSSIKLLTQLINLIDYSNRIIIFQCIPAEIFHFIRPDAPLDSGQELRKKGFLKNSLHD